MAAGTSASDPGQKLHGRPTWVLSRLVGASAKCAGARVVLCHVISDRPRGGPSQDLARGPAASSRLGPNVRTTRPGRSTSACLGVGKPVGVSAPSPSRRVLEGFTPSHSAAHRAYVSRAVRPHNS